MATARIAPKVCHGQPPTFGGQLSKFHPIEIGSLSASYSRPREGRSKCTSRIRVFPITRRSIASRRVNKSISQTAEIRIMYVDVLHACRASVESTATMFVRDSGSGIERGNC